MSDNIDTTTHTERPNDLDKSLRLNPDADNSLGTYNLGTYNYVTPESLSFFRTSTLSKLASEKSAQNDSAPKTAPKDLTAANLTPYPYIYTSPFIMQCLANQVAHAEPEPEIAIATCDPETLEEAEIPYVTADSVVPPLEEATTPTSKQQAPSELPAKAQPDAKADNNDKAGNTDIDTTANQSVNNAHINNKMVANDSLLRQSTPAGIDQTNDPLQARHILNNADKSDAKNNNDTHANTADDATKPVEKATQYDELVKKERPKDEEEIRAEKESKLESYKQFVAKQESKVDIDYPAIRVSIEANALPSRMYFIMNALSAVIASYGLVMNSAAVVIGAMLVAMMLGPISGSALAIIDYRIPLLRKSILTVVAGATMVLFIGYMIGSIHEGRPLTNEILSRTQPTSMDLMVALAGGTAGAYAMISPHLSVAVVGVAVATALVPPLAASGILFANGEMALGFGALLLAITNIIAIQFTNGLVLWFAGFRRLMGEDYKSSTHLAFFRRNAVPLVLLTGIGIYLSYNLNNIATRQNFENEVTDIVEDYFIDKDNMLDATQFINKPNHLTIRAVITGQTRPNSSDVKYLEDKITTRMTESTPDLPDIQLQLRYIPVVVIESTPRLDDRFGKTDAALLSTE